MHKLGTKVPQIVCIQHDDLCRLSAKRNTKSVKRNSFPYTQARGFYTIMKKGECHRHHADFYRDKGFHLKLGKGIMKEINLKFGVNI